MTVIRVAHAGADYAVTIGDLASALLKLKDVAHSRKLPVISDERIYDLYGKQLAEVAMAEPILVPEGEAAKNWDSLGAIVRQLALLDVKRGTPLIALGGGSIGDVAGLAASLFKRGCPIVHIPTTLLAQVDSAIGGKTAIDAAGQKNLVGTFHHPLLVIAEPRFLRTLDRRQLRSGFAEIIKYGLIDDLGFFSWCEANWDGLLVGDPPICQSAIEHCLRAKARFVTADPNDSNGTRALLNFGHTFGHAAEALAGGTLLHGEAVALGMNLAFGFSVAIGCCPRADAERVRAVCRAAGLPSTLGEAGLAGKGFELGRAMLADKKTGSDGLTLILTRGIGEAYVARGVELAQVSDFLARSV